MKRLKKYIRAMDGSWGCRVRYEKEVCKGEPTSAWLAGHYSSLLDDALSLIPPAILELAEELEQKQEGGGDSL